jgi:hypothetical protein
MYERGRLQSVTGSFAAQVILRESTELVVHDGHELIECRLIAFAPGNE